MKRVELVVRILMVLWVVLITENVRAQTLVVSGTVKDRQTTEPLIGSNIFIKGTTVGTMADPNGYFSLEVPKEFEGRYLSASYLGYTLDSVLITAARKAYHFNLMNDGTSFKEVVISGTMKEVSKTESPIPVEVYTPAFFKKNPTANIFEALTMVNGVQPQLNCSVCNTGDIHINGMEGPYTMILIDGMPIVSSLSTVYGLSGIPHSMVKRIEISKGPASTLYGSEAVGGLINIITKDLVSAPLLKVDVSGTTWNEYNLDISAKFKMNKVSSLLGVNGFWFNKAYDRNSDGFTDVPLQRRGSVFSKWNFGRKDDKYTSVAVRYVFENRWGGQTNWAPIWRGTDSIYGESIITNRMELIGHYDLPFRNQNFRLQYSYNFHHQDSYYGKVKYLAQQHTAFAQLLYDKKIGRHDLLFGVPFRFISYDDNSPATETSEQSTTRNKPAYTYLPGVFAQDEWQIHKTFTALMGMRYDYNNEHGHIFTPRLSFKYSPQSLHTIRLTGGNGYRVVNLFTEDHAALTGARKVIITERLRPEQSWNVNLNYVFQVNHKKGFIAFDISGFYTYFTNKITADFDSDPNKIIYDNLKGYAISRGVSFNTDLAFTNGLKIILGGTFMDVYQVENDSLGRKVRTKQLFAPNFSGTYAVSYTINKIGLSIDWTGLVKGPMRLPILPNDFRPEYSPWFCLMNIQLTQKIRSKVEIYGGVKNMLNFVPSNPIMRANDPFDKDVNNPVTNPNGYTFDPSYNYAPVQGAKVFFGLRYNL